jgi:hypothetical protein
MADTISVQKIAGLFKQILLGRAVTAQKIAPFRISATEPSATAVYQDTTGGTAAVCVCDVDLVHKAGAALCLIPADSRLSAAKIDPALAENFQEILNICAQLFSGPDGHRVTLHSVLLSADKRPPEIVAMVASPPWRLDVKLAITGYGEGRISVFSRIA